MHSGNVYCPARGASEIDGSLSCFEVGQLMAEKPETVDVFVNVLGYRDDQEKAWVALAVDMDLRGYGKTFSEALKELKELVVTQIDFALFKSQPEMIWKPAEPEYHRLFETARQERLRWIMASSPPRHEPTTEIRGLSFPPGFLASRRKGSFSQISG